MDASHTELTLTFTKTQRIRIKAEEIRQKKELTAEYLNQADTR